MKGKIIEFNGLDCSFKETNTKRLVEYIRENITDKVKLISFPNYDSNSSYFVKQYLSGAYKNTSIDEKTISLFYSLDRFDTVNKLNIKQLLEDGYYIIFDRYIGSNALYQTVNMESVEDKLNYLESLYNFENNVLKLPKPDIEILLLNHPDIVYSILESRKNKSVSGDIIENDKTIMYKLYNNAFTISELLKWKVVKCFDSSNLNIKHKDEIFNNILEILLKDKIIK